jgi:hypothetical protein
MVEHVLVSPHCVDNKGSQKIDRIQGQENRPFSATKTRQNKCHKKEATEEKSANYRPGPELSIGKVVADHHFAISATPSPFPNLETSSSGSQRK